MKKKIFSSRHHFNLWKRKRDDKLPKNPRIQGDQRGKRKVFALGMQAAELCTQRLASMTRTEEPAAPQAISSSSLPKLTSLLPFAGKSVHEVPPQPGIRPRGKPLSDQMMQGRGSSQGPADSFSLATIFLLLF